MMAEDGGDCEEVLSDFTAAGIDINALAERLQDEGTKSFAKSWNSLMAVIASKREPERRQRSRDTQLRHFRRSYGCDESIFG